MSYSHFARTVPTMDELAGRFLDFARTCRTTAPLYSRLATRIADEPEILGLMSVADPTQRIPVLLFASVHFLLLSEIDQDLARHYPNLLRRAAGSSDRISPDPDSDAANAFVRFVLERSDPLTQLLATKSTQTNEIGRCSWFLFPLSILDQEVGPLARVDIGSSAGLTLLFSDLAYEFPPFGFLGEPGCLTLRFAVRGRPPLPERLPRIDWSMGLDARPLDLFDESQVRWLEACVWPDHVERFERLVSAVEQARKRGIRVEQGDAVADIGRLVDTAAAHGHPVVTTSWVMNYLTSAQRSEFVAALDSQGAQHDLSWVVAESPRETPELPVHGEPDEDITVLSLITWRGGRRQSRRLATTHPHGNWVAWGS